MNDKLVLDIKNAFQRVLDNVEKAARVSERHPEEIKVVVVSKGQSVEKIQAAITAGIRLFGENYPEEAQEKITILQPPPDVEWHMIGHLQSRKIKTLTESFKMLQSLDTVRLATKLNNYLLAKRAHSFPVFLELNVSGEDSKFGFPAWDDKVFRTSLNDIERIFTCEKLSVLGVMAIPPLFPHQEESRPFHRRLYNIFTELKRLFPGHNLHAVSTGTSYDYEVAIQEGSTYIRVGEAIMGTRIKPG